VKQSRDVNLMLDVNLHELDFEDLNLIVKSFLALGNISLSAGLFHGSTEPLKGSESVHEYIHLFQSAGWNEQLSE